MGPAFFWPLKSKKSKKFGKKISLYNSRFFQFFYRKWILASQVSRNEIEWPEQCFNSTSQEENGNKRLNQVRRRARQFYPWIIWTSWRLLCEIWALFLLIRQAWVIRTTYYYFFEVTVKSDLQFEIMRPIRTVFSTILIIRITSVIVKLRENGQNYHNLDFWLYF